MDKHKASKRAKTAFHSFLKEQVEVILQAHPSRPDEFRSAKAIVAYWSRINAALSGGGGFIPGPVGMVTALPVLMAEIRNQVCMLKDIASFYHKEHLLDKNLVMLILFYSSGSAGGKFIVIKGGEVLLAKTTPRIIQQILLRLSIRYSERAIGKFLAVWLPYIGAASLGGWSYITCKTLGKLAISIFSKEIKSGITGKDISETEETPSPQEHYDIALNTLRAMVEMMFADNDASPQELQIIKENLDAMVNTIPPDVEFEKLPADINNYIVQYGISRVSKIDFTLFRQNEDAKESLITLLMAVGKASNGVSAEEVKYIEDVCEKIAYDYHEAIATMLSI